MKDTSDNHLSPTIAFILNSNIKFGAGTEKVVFYYIKYKPEYINNVILVQIPSLDNSENRLKDSDLNDIYKSANIVYMDPVYYKVIKILERFPKFQNIPYRMVIHYISLLLLKFTVYRKLYEKINKPDIIYLFRNYYAFFFKKKNFLVGSTHAWSSPNSNILKIIDKITSLIFRDNIKVYHSFPTYANGIKELLPNKKIISIPNGVESDNFKPIIYKNEKITFLFVARIEECKGIFRLLEAWMDFKDLENIELNIVGSGSAVNEMKKMISGIKNINYLGIVPENQLYEIYGKSDVFIYPSSCDTFGLVILEALSSGLFVITTDLFKGIFPEFEKVNGLYFCSNDKKCFSDAIKYAINNIDHIRSKKEELHRLAKEYYDWKVVVRKLYDEMIKAYNEFKQQS